MFWNRSSRFEFGFLATREIQFAFATHRSGSLLTRRRVRESSLCEYLGFLFLPTHSGCFFSFLGAATRYSLLRIPGVAVFVNNFKESATPIDKSANKCYNDSKLINQTVEAEITATMPSQRAQGAEIWVRNKLSNGPRRAQSKAKCFAEYSATLQADVICRGYVGILLSAQPFWDVNQGGTADKYFIRP